MMIVTTALVAAGFVASLATAKVAFGQKRDEKQEVVELGLVNDTKKEAGQRVETKSASLVQTISREQVTG
ncbi:hypothetical protein PILCRDRAFT_822616 [Piloderma croceum F 1598]|uniref:Uncharacterized protein n=1 Tax=Piloderma croceum (strain F 1598) TaxID=765440 RepID=A0A0C3F684_PILCF|nr:hypothetical protein PILCRDRAFT_822616 [Piloderma croceum F 1598]